MPERITYEEALIEKTAAKAKELVEILNEQSLWSGETPHTSPTHDGKEEEQKVIRPKAKNISEKNPVGGELIVKAPPIDNPRWVAGKVSQINDNLTIAEYEKLFEEKVDPIIESMEAEGASYAAIDPKELGMRSKRALEVAKELYKGRGYGNIFLSSGKLNFRLEA